MLRRRSRAFRRNGIVLLLLCSVVFILSTSPRSGAESEVSSFLRVYPFGSATAPQVIPGTLDTTPDPRAVAVAQQLRLQLSSLQTANRRTATLASMTPEQVQAFAALEQQAQAEVEVRLRPTTGTPMQISGAMLHPAVPGGIPGPTRDEKTARTFLRTYCHLLQLDSPDHELTLTQHNVDSLGRCHLRFAQQYRNLPVWPAEVLVHLDTKGNVDLFEGAFVPTPRKILTDPVVSANTAVATARTIVPQGALATASAPELIIYAPLESRSRLAWKMELSVSETSRWLVIIDAVSGTKLTAYNQVMDANVAGSGIDVFGSTRPLNVFQEGSTFFMVDTSKPMFDPTSDPPDLDKTRGGIVVLDAQNKEPDPLGRISVSQVTSNSATSGWLPDAVSASFSLSQTYDYYLERHSRNSLDGQGGTMIAIVRLGTNFNNAAWNGQMMLFGDALPFTGATDVVAHELTHGVTQYSANLVYLNQSGALNEAFSDIFGEATEARTFGGPDWLVGASLGQPLRNLTNPGAIEICPGCGGYPSTMSEFIVTAQDNGGVHINSTIIGRAFYLLAEGLNGALGIRDAERIFYRALTTHLVRNSQFIDARLACIQAATELFGAGSPQVNKTTEAFSTVGISDAPPTPEPPTIPAVNGPDATLFLRRDAGGAFLARREEGRGDPSTGVRLSSTSAKATRPAVSGDGTIAVFVNAASDLCFLGTDGTSGEICLGFPGTIGSASISRDGQLFGLVLLNASGTRDNRLSIIDLGADKVSTFLLTSPAVDGVSANSVQFADSMDFTADQQFLLYDAFNQVTLVDGTSFGVWSIYALDLATGTTQTIVPPTRGVDIAFPFLGHTSDDLLTFDSLDQNSQQSTVFACKLSTGDCVAVATVNGDFGAPSYSGDDNAIIYSQVDTSTTTRFSLMRQPLAGDRITPSGSPSLWLSNADFNVIYRRATTTPPPVGGVSLENPAPGSSQSGVGLISGWLCNANRVDIDVDGRVTLQAAYGTERLDTQSACGDANNGFGLLVNWNLLGNGSHRVRVLADGVEVSNSTFTVTTLGLGEFPRGLSGSFEMQNFPSGGKTTRIQWQESTQNFVITNASGTGSGGGSNSAGTFLENPAPGSFQSGIGLISGWICNANRVDIDVDGRVTLQAAYGTERNDTLGVCGDTNNGYGLLVNWNLLGDGTHSVRVLADGVEVGNSTFTVTTLGLGQFPQGLSGTFMIPDFPQSGKQTQIQWQESGQNFVITNVQ
ncbi:MAG: M4 family metallopeptidase [Candidatus Binatia bacterium]